MKFVNCWDIQSFKTGGDLPTHQFYIIPTAVKNEWLRDNKNGSAIQREFIFFDTLGEIENFKNGEIRMAALAKLTDIERKCLGV